MRNNIIKLVCCIILGCSIVGGIHAQILQRNDKQLKTASMVAWPNFNLLDTNLLGEYLGKKLKERGYSLKIHPEHHANDSDLTIVIWKAYPQPTPDKIDTSYLVQIESPIELKMPPDKKTISHFRKIFTHKKSATDNQKIFYSPIPYYGYFGFYDELNRTKPEPILPADIRAKNVLIAQVAGYMHSANPNENYKSRISAIIWLLEHHPEDVVFYGKRWKGILPKLSPAGKTAFNERYKNYAPDKRDALKQAKFGLAYENIKVTDYVSEKIYDVMLAGTVPVYSGADNITDYVPQACFVNRNDFKSDDDLYTFLKTMPDKKYMDYIDCINHFIKNLPNHKSYYKNVIDQWIYEIFDDRTEKTVEVGYTGGLGNQMFEYATAFAYAKKHHKDLYQNASGNEALNLFLNVTAPLSRTSFRPYSRQPKSIQNKLRQQHSYGGSFNERMYLNPNFLVSLGYNQNENFFKEFADDIRQEFSFKKPVVGESLKTALKMKNECSICVHFRRGDYIKYKYPIPSLPYYENGIRYITDHDKDQPHVYIFSNDMKWVKQNVSFNVPFTYVDWNKQGWEDMQLMTYCRHHVIAASTFSWWGAWLAPYPNKIVIMPDTWFKKSEAEALKVDGWMQMPSYSTYGI